MLSYVSGLGSRMTPHPHLAAVGRLPPAAPSVCAQAGCGAPCVLSASVPRTD